MKMGEIISQDVSGRLKRSLGHYTDLTSLTSQLADKAKQSKNYVLISQYNNLFTNNDWTTAINTAMTDLKNNGGGKLLFESGNYNIKGNITVPDTVYLQGAGKNVTTLVADATMSGVFINLGKNVSSGVTNLTLKGNRYSQSANLTTGLKLGLSDSDTVGVVCDGIEVHDIKITSFYGNGLECYRKQWVYSMDNIIIQLCTGIGFKANCTDNNFSNFWINNCPTGLAINDPSNKFVNFKLDFCGSDTTAAVEANGTGQTLLSNIEVQCAQGLAYRFTNCSGFQFSNVYADQTGFGGTYSGTNAIAFTYTNCYGFNGNAFITENTADSSQVKLNKGIWVNSGSYDITVHTKFKGLINTSIKKQIDAGAYKIILDNSGLMKSTLLSGYLSLKSVEPTFSDVAAAGQVNTGHGTYVQNGDGTTTVTVGTVGTLHRLGFKAYNFQQNRVYLCYAEVDTNAYSVSFNITNNNPPFAFYGVTTFPANSSGYLAQYGLVAYKEDPVAMNPSVYLATTATGNDTFNFKNLMILDVTDVIQDVDMDTIIDVIKNNVGLFYGTTSGGTTKAIGASARIV
jgi:hypothetical protein